VRTLLASAVAVSLIACTETPSSFPPCIYTAPCPDSAIPDEGGPGDSDVGDAGEAPDAGSNADAPNDAPSD
jgi:hypothetical protein